MRRLTNNHLSFIIPLACISISLFADEHALEQLPGMLPDSKVEETQTDVALGNQLETEIISSQEISAEPRILVRYYSADAVQALERLKPLAALEPEYNKIIIKLEGYPKNKEIFFDVKRIVSKDPQSYETKMSFSIQNDGTLLITNTNRHLLSLICSSRGYLPGELVTFRFRTADNAISKEVSGIPTPATIKDKEHHVVLQAELMSEDPTVYNILLPSMNEGEEFELKSTSLGAIVKGKPIYHKGMPLHYAPGVKGKRGGDATFEIRRKSGEVYSILLPWGSSLTGYLHGDKVYSPTL